jgi:hypothetical protein
MAGMRQSAGRQGPTHLAATSGVWRAQIFHPGDQGVPDESSVDHGVRFITLRIPRRAQGDRLGRTRAVIDKIDPARSAERRIALPTVLPGIGHIGQRSRGHGAGK